MKIAFTSEKEGKYYRLNDSQHNNLQFLPVRVLTKTDTNISSKAQTKREKNKYFKILDKNTRSPGFFKIGKNGEKNYIDKDEQLM